MYFYPTMDYRSLVVVVISISPSNRVIFLVCLYAFLNCPSSRLPLSSISFKNNGVEVQKIIKINVYVPTVQLMISFPTEEGFLCDLHKLMHFALCTRKFNEFPQPSFQPLARVVIGSTKRLAQSRLFLYLCLPCAGGPLPSFAASVTGTKPPAWHQLAASLHVSVLFLAR